MICNLTRISRNLRLGILLLPVFMASASIAQDTFQLAPPYLKYSSVFFEKAVRVTMDFAQPNTRIHYTTNGEEPTERDPVYSRPLLLKKHLVTLKARAFGPEFHPSETVEAKFYKTGLPIQSISTTPPHERYPGGGSSTLIDGQGGIHAISSKTWMGFQSDSVVIVLTLKKPHYVRQVLLHVLQNQASWIFAPAKIALFGMEKGSTEWTFMEVFNLNSTKKTDYSGYMAMGINPRKLIKTTQIMLKVYPLAKLPEWHPGKGNLAWLFIDEINIY